MLRPCTRGPGLVTVLDFTDARSGHDGSCCEREPGRGLGRRMGSSPGHDIDRRERDPSRDKSTVAVSAVVDVSPALPLTAVDASLAMTLVAVSVSPATIFTSVVMRSATALGTVGPAMMSVAVDIRLAMSSVVVRLAVVLVAMNARLATRSVAGNANQPTTLAAPGTVLAAAGTASTPVDVNSKVSTAVDTTSATASVLGGLTCPVNI